MMNSESSQSESDTLCFSKWYQIPTYYETPQGDLSGTYHSGWCLKGEKVYVISGHECLFSYCKSTNTYTPHLGQYLAEDGTKDYIYCTLQPGYYVVSDYIVTIQQIRQMYDEWGRNGLKFREDVCNPYASASGLLPVANKYNKEFCKIAEELYPTVKKSVAHEKLAYEMHNFPSRDNVDLDFEDLRPTISDFNSKGPRLTIVKLTDESGVDFYIRCSDLFNDAKIYSLSLWNNLITPLIGTKVFGFKKPIDNMFDDLKYGHGVDYFEKKLSESYGVVPEWEVVDIGMNPENPNGLEAAVKNPSASTIKDRLLVLKTNDQFYYILGNRYSDSAIYLCPEKTYRAYQSKLGRAYLETREAERRSEEAKQERLMDYQKRWGADWGQKIYDGKVEIGMTYEMCVAALGKPIRSEKYVTAGYTSEQYIFVTKEITIVDGKVTAIMDSHLVDDLLFLSIF